WHATGSTLIHRHARSQVRADRCLAPIACTGRLGCSDPKWVALEPALGIHTFGDSATAAWWYKWCASATAIGSVNETIDKAFANVL
ncbi:MAG: hypothetical protein WBD31_15890, partial [Rubripirellula sp.]